MKASELLGFAKKLLDEKRFSSASYYQISGAVKKVIASIGDFDLSNESHVQSRLDEFVSQASRQMPTTEIVRRFNRIYRAYQSYQDFLSKNKDESAWVLPRVRGRPPKNGIAHDVSNETIVYPFVFKGKKIGRIFLPIDLTPSEAERLIAFVRFISEKGQ